MMQLVDDVCDYFVLFITSLTWIVWFSLLHVCIVMSVMFAFLCVCVCFCTFGTADFMF